MSHDFKAPHSPPPSYSHPAQTQPVYDHYSQQPQSQNYHTHQGDHHSSSKQGPYPRPYETTNTNLPPGEYPASFDKHGNNKHVAYYESGTSTSGTGTGTTTMSSMSGTGFDTRTGTGTVTTGRRTRRKREKDVATGFCAGCLGACCCCAACGVM